MKEKFTHFIKVITGKAYGELKVELENAVTAIEGYKHQIDILDADIEKLIDSHKKQLDIIEKRHIDTLNKALDNLENIKKDFKKLEADAIKKEKKYQEKNEERKAAIKDLKKAHKVISELEEEKKQLKEQVDFLKTHRRAPSIEELKDYTTRRKRTKTEGK